MPKNETLILFFEEKRFMRACINRFFIACVLLSKYHSFCWKNHAPQLPSFSPQFPLA